jgi:hypothetical protein
MSARSDRFERLRDNWGQLTAGRIAMFARETSRFSEEVIEDAITSIMHELEYTPVLKHVIAACIAAERRRASRQPKKKNGYRPGEVGPDGRPTFTPEEARQELKRLRKTNPEWFSRELDLKLDSRRSLELNVSRIYVNGLRRCANLDGRSIIEAEQAHLF